jgi:N6-adenosine-specific RNA methylase IME4
LCNYFSEKLYIETKASRRQPVSSKELTQILGKKVRRKERVERILKNNRPLDASLGIFNVILADPPWQYRTVISESRRIENHYPTMSLEAIKALPVSAITAPDAVLFLWAIGPGVEEALEVLRVWGFEYRSQVVWVKPSIGPGHWIRQRHELLLLGVKGDIPVPLPENRPDSVITANRREHSEKPEEAHLLIERAFSEFPKIELFSRCLRPGWVVWGNEASSTEPAPDKDSSQDGQRTPSDQASKTAPSSEDGQSSPGVGKIEPDYEEGEA